MLEQMSEEKKNVNHMLAFKVSVKPSFSIRAQDILKVEGNLNTIVGALLVFGLFKSRKISFPLLPPKPCFCLWHFLSLLRVPRVLGTEPGTCMLSLVFRAYKIKWLHRDSRPLKRCGATT